MRHFSLIILNSVFLSTTFFLTIVVLIFLSFLFNETSDFYLGSKPAAEQAQTPGLTVEETEILRRLTEKQQRMSKAAESTLSDQQTEAGREIPIEEIYTENLVALQAHA